jgi:serine/threonine protein kinase
VILFKYLDIIEDVLGEGSEAVVLKGLDENTGKRVAIKKYGVILNKNIPPKQWTRQDIQKDIDFATDPKLDCIYLLKYLDYFEFNKDQFVVMPYCDKGDLNVEISKLRVSDYHFSEKVYIISL